MKSEGIELSPKHGLNPSLDLCFWCGEAMGVALVGRIRRNGESDAEAPHEMCTGLKPCPECAKKWSTGVPLIEVTEDGSRFGGNERWAFKPKGSQPVWPTGRWVVVKPEAVNGGERGKAMLCDTTVIDRILSIEEKVESDPGEGGEK